MAEVNTDKGKNDGKKGKQKKMTVRVPKAKYSDNDLKSEHPETLLQTAFYIFF